MERCVVADTAAQADFMAGVKQEHRPIVERLVEIMRNSPEPLDSALKRKQLTFARQGDFHHWVCAISTTAKAVALNFHFGGLLDDPEGRFRAGSSRFLRKLEYRTVDDIDESVVLEFVSQALARLQYFKDNWKAIEAGSK